MKGKLLCALLIFGILYSLYISVYIGVVYVGLVMVLLTVGLFSTLYVLENKTDYRIIFYIWIAIISVSVSALLFQWVGTLFPYLTTATKI